MYTLQSGKQHAVAFTCKDSGQDVGEISPTLRSVNFDKSHANGGGQVAIAFNLRGREDGSQAEVTDVASIRSGSGGSSRSYVSTEYAVRRLSVIECCRLQGFPDLYAYIKGEHNRKIEADEAQYLLAHEIYCWQDDDQWFTDIVADGPCYRALGNSFPVPILEWFGIRMEIADAAVRKAKQEAA